MSIPYELAVKEDLEIGHGTVSRTNPSGGAALTGNKIGLHTLTDIYNVKHVGAAGDGVTDDATAFQDAIDLAATNNGKVFIPEGTYKINSGLVIDTAITLEGASKSVILDFSALASGDAVTIGSSSPPPNGTVLRSFRIKGNTSVNGLRLNSLGSAINVARCYFENLTIDTFNRGLLSTYFTTAVFVDVEFTGCTLGWESQTQTNNIAMFGGRFVNCGQFATFTTSEGISFYGGQFQNITDVATTEAVSLRQSSVNLDNAYFENLSNADIATLGASGDTIGCSFVMTGGIAPPKNVRYRENLRHVVKIVGVRTASGTDNVGISNISTSGNWFLPDASLVNTRGAVDTLDGEVIDEFWWNNRSSFASTAGVIQPDHVQISKAGGFTYSATLVTGDPYTLVYAIRRPSAGTISIRYRDGGGGIIQTLAFEDSVALDSKPWELRFMPFDTVGVTFEMIFSDHTYELKLFRLLKGHVFVRPDIFANIPIWGTAAPTTGTWERGTIVWNSAAAAGSPIGWMCSVAGTPGTWVAMANL